MKSNLRRGACTWLWWDGLKTFWVETKTKTETWAPETETRPRRLPNCPRRDRDETLECPRRDRDETFFWSRLYRDTWLINAWYMHFTLCPKKESLRLGWKKQVNKQSLIKEVHWWFFRKIFFIEIHEKHSAVCYRLSKCNLPKKIGCNRFRVLNNTPIINGPLNVKFSHFFMNRKLFLL